MTANGARAQAGGVDSRLREARDERARSQRERDSLQAELRRLEMSTRDLAAETRNLERQADATARAVNALNRQLREINAEVDSASGALVRSQDELLIKQATLQRRVVDIYKRGPLQTVEALLSAASFGELVARYKYLRIVTLRDRALLQRTQQLQNDVRNKRTRLVSLQGELVTSREDKAEEEQRLRSLEAQWAARVSRSQTQAQRAQMQLRRVMADASRLDSIVAELDAARLRGDTRAGAAAPLSRTLSTADLGKLDWPVEGEIIYSFGRLRNPNNTILRWNGIGIAAAPNTPVRAVAAGLVVFAQPFDTWGNTVIVSHGSALSVYASLGRVTVRVTDNVERGQQIGVVGVSDPEKGPMLHFEIRPDGRMSVDPIEWLKKRQ
ncbi:MAG TPA: peptidoglycan DD-metalloendopeptidase family protein [Gemmatimonadaceae bacterium]|nr:peptidoglycan DD-metalloendopeptidase family protein [Gemmatimonadaceae bacterium]